MSVRNWALKATATAKILINAAGWHVPRVTDAVLDDRLRLGMAARPQLM